SGRFVDEIVPVSVPRTKGPPELFQVDEHPRQTSLQKLAALPPVFKSGGTVTAGNSSGRNDGAAALVIMAEEAARARGLTPMASIVGLGMSALSPDIMGLGPVEASRRALQHAGLKLEQMDLVEINEAFAAQVLAVLRGLPVPMEKLNVNGGAIALGHPIGSSGARICVTLLHEMAKRGAGYGLASLCAAGGQGIATVFRLVS
ncbi:MAG TPA: thiolase family protein, partial [Limnochordales bacterium]|nr:thiolase family protein [Limnochordales bacterium]